MKLRRLQTCDDPVPMGLRMRVLFRVQDASHHPSSGPFSYGRGEADGGALPLAWSVCSVVQFLRIAASKVAGGNTGVWRFHSKPRLMFPITRYSSIKNRCGSRFPMTLSGLK